MRLSVVCSPEIPCHQFRTCDYCARLRQARIAEMAAARHLGESATFATITGLAAHHVPAARAMRPGAGGLWSIEIGEKMRGLHINFLFDSQKQIDAGVLAEMLPIPGLEYWAKTVPSCEVRQIAAYINKRDGCPSRREFDGRLYGTWGTWRSVRTIAQTYDQRPVVQAAAIEAELRAFELAPAPSANEVIHRKDHKAIAAKHLPGLWQALGIKK